jgi:hypothetical protein
MFSQQKEEKRLVKIRTLIRFGSICLSLQNAKAKEENPNWGAKNILDELHVAYSERSVKNILSL